MSETPGYEVGQVENGHRWTGHDWEPVDTADPDEAASPEQVAAPAAAPAAADPSLLGTPQSGGAALPGATWQTADQADTASDPLEPAYGAPFVAGGPTPFAAAAPLFLLGVLVAVGVSIAGIMVINSSGGGILWWGGYFVTFALWRSALSRYRAAKAASGTGLGGLGTAVAAVGVVIAVGAAGAFALVWAQDSSAPALTETVGSCWAPEGDQVMLVACDSADAQYVALKEVTNEADCPVSALGSIETETAGRYLCLGLK